MKIATLLTLFLLCVCAFGQEAVSPSKTASPEIYFAKDDGSGKAGESAGNFVTTDIPIHCVIQLDSADPVTVRMNLIAVKVPGVKAETKVISTAYTTKDGENRVNFSGRPHGLWVAGRYRADIFIGDSLTVSREFMIQQPLAPIPASEGIADPKNSTKPKATRRVKKT